MTHQLVRHLRVMARVPLHSSCAKLLADTPGSQYTWLWRSKRRAAVASRRGSEDGGMGGKDRSALRAGTPSKR